MSRLRIAVFASGNGSNFQAIADAVQAGELDVDIELLVCDKPRARVVERAEQAGVPTFLFEPKQYPSRAAYEQEILVRLQELKVELVVLAGYMRILTDTLVTPFMGRMINIHPSLLPSFPGVHAAQQALDHGVKVTGVTVHFVDGGMDTGPIIAQRAVPIPEGTTEDTLMEAIHAEEVQLYPRVVQWIADGRVHLDGRQVRIEKQ